MMPQSEARIVGECLKFLMNGSLYKGLKPVMWSVVEKTALAEAEVEYHERVSSTIFVRFPLKEAGKEFPKDIKKDIKDASILIWTTTPWTIPGNRAIAYSPKMSYGIYEVREGERAGEILLLADRLCQQVADAASCRMKRLGDVKDPARYVARHPFHGEGYDFDVPLLEADYVTEETGTGFVHTAPGHGREDFELCAKHKMEVPDLLDDAGSFRPFVPLFAGARVFDEKGKEGDANARVLQALAARTMLFAKGKLRHDYPHSWRSKAPVIFRATPQWFISMEEKNLRAIALREIKKVRWHPPQGERRLAAMVENRPDWVVSRQRSWGVPLTLFLHKETGAILKDEKVNARIMDAVAKKGADIWFEAPPKAFLGEDYREKEWEKVEDILDVWFESGATQAFVLEDRPELQWPASLYLEGSDQHRGWFQSSLLVACGTKGRAPYESVLTHGFVLDAKGHKMSKSLGNIIDPMEITEARGAELLRLWVGASDTTEDMRFSEEVMKSTSEAYRKIRNALRFLLGNLHHFDERESVKKEEMPELERFMLDRMAFHEKEIRKAYEDFNFKKATQLLFNFITQDLSSFYFDIRKDALYCDPASSLKRRAARTVLHHLFRALTAWLSPILPFTMEEAWLARGGEAADPDASLHLEGFPEIPPSWRDDALSEKWQRIRAIRHVVTAALEEERQAGRIGASLDAAPEIYLESEKDWALLHSLDMAEIAITSQCVIKKEKVPKTAFSMDAYPHIGVRPLAAKGKRCARSWKILPEVGAVEGYPDLSARDAQAVREYEDAQK